jgi:transposase InsO family protein
LRGAVLPFLADDPDDFVPRRSPRTTDSPAKRFAGLTPVIRRYSIRPEMWRERVCRLGVRGICRRCGMLPRAETVVFFVVPTATFRLLFVLVLLAHDRRRVVHVAVTEHPTAAWTVQQFRDAFPWDEAPRYLLRDRNHAFDHVNTIGIQEVLTAPSSPWQNASVERLIGSIRRECLDHIIIANERGLRRVLNASVEYLLQISDSPVAR